MPWNGSGVFQRVRNWVNDASSGVKIRADYHDSEDDSFAAGITNCIARDGQSTILANIPFNAKRITGLADPVNPQDAVTQKWVGDNVIGGALIADAPPAAGKTGNLWWDSDQGGLFLRYDDGSSVQWVQVNVASPPAYQTGAFKRTVLTASTSGFQFDPDAHYADIEVLGGGGGGGASGSSVTNQGAAGTGGGGGGYCKKLIQVTDTVRAATKTITVGALGSASGPTAGGQSKYDDGTNTLTANGGAAGAAGIGSGNIVQVGGGGGVASGGDVNCQGWRGTDGRVVVLTAGGNAACLGGVGGHSCFGSGGVGGQVNTNAATNAPGVAATGFGAGGGGAVTCYGGGVPGGGNGSQGVVIITEYR